MRPINTLNFYGDGDDVDAVCRVEEAFGISITDEEAIATQTVGQLHDLIELKGGSRSTEACYSQIAFYRLRLALIAEGHSKFTPDTSIDILRSPEITKAWRRLARESGLRFPPLETPFKQWVLPWPLNRVAYCGMAVSLFVPIWLVQYLTDLAFPGALVVGAASGVIAWVVSAQLIYLAFRNIPQRIRTVGDLARECAGFSFSDMKQTRPMAGPADRWQALTAILREICGHKAPITRETTFFARQ